MAAEPSPEVGMPGAASPEGGALVAASAANASRPAPSPPSVVVATPPPGRSMPPPPPHAMLDVQITSRARAQRAGVASGDMAILLLISRRKRARHRLRACLHRPAHGARRREAPAW